MTTITPPVLGSAQLMPGFPCTEHGEQMPNASWYQISTSVGAVSYVAVSLHGVYQCSPTGRIRDFFVCLYERQAIDTQSDALRRIGFEVSA